MEKENIVETQVKKHSYKLLFWVLGILKIFLVFVFPYIIAWLLIVIVLYIVMVFILILTSIDLTNVPYYYTKQETRYNLPVISTDFIKEYATTTLKYESNVIYSDEIKVLKPNEQVWKFFEEYKNLKFQTDLISNIYFYSDNQKVLWTILYPLRFLDVWDIKIVNWNLYTKIKWEDFYYSFDWKDVSRWLNEKELKAFNKAYEKAFGKNIQPQIKELISFSDTANDNVKKQLLINRWVKGYGLSFDKVNNNNDWLMWYYRITYYLDFWKDIKTQMVETIYNSFAYDMVNKTLIKNILNNTTGEKAIFEKFVDDNYRTKNTINNVSMEDILKDYLNEKKESKMYNLYQCLKTYDISMGELKKTNICVNGKIKLNSGKELNNYETINILFDNYNKDIIKELVSNPDLYNNVMKFINNRNLYWNTKNDWKANPQLKISNPYFWFYEKYNEYDWGFTVNTNKIQLSPQTYLYSINQMKNEWINMELWFDFKKEFLSTNNNGTNYQYSYGSVLENNVENTINTALSNGNNSFFNKYRESYFPQNSLRKNTYEFQKNWDIQEKWKKITSLKAKYWNNIQTFSKYWNYFIYWNYKENFEFYQIGDYYYVNSDWTTILENKNSESKTYFNIYDINWINNITKKNIYRVLTSDEWEAVLYIDKWSENTFQQKVASSSRNWNKITRNNMDWYLKLVYDKSKDPVQFNSKLDSKTNTAWSNDVSSTQYFYLFNWYEDRTLVDNTVYYVETFFWWILYDKDMDIVFNSYSMMLNNNKIEKQYDNLILNNERNPFEFITYYYNRWEDVINLTSLVRKTIWKTDIQTQIDIENSYAQYKDFWIAFLKYYSASEKTDIQIMINDIPWYCKTYNDEPSCIKTLTLFKKSYNSDSNRTYYENYIELKDIFVILDKKGE